VHNGQQKPNMGRKKKGAKWVKRPAKSNGFGVMTEGIQTHVGRAGGRVAAFIVLQR